ncbi:MAG: EamA family transporter [Nocardioides sp.]
MTAMAPDISTGRHGRSASVTRAGLLFALLSAVSFGMSGALARPLLDDGWSAGAVVLIRIGLAAVVVVPFGVVSLRGRWGLLRRNAALIVTYGLLAVAGAQFCYFSAVQYMQVGPALLIEYTAPAAVVVWLRLRHGQRPGVVTLLGAGLAALGLVLLLDLMSGADLSVAGVLWALAAMVGAATYFVISADETNGLPPMVLAAGGLVVGAVALGLLGLVGLLPLDAAGSSVTYAGLSFAPWVPLVVLGLVTAALAYTSGIAAGRRLGSRVASFVALSEVVAAVAWAWALLDELPRPVQLVGGLLILGGVASVKLGERTTP